jgi:hypothetical protein
VIILDTNVVSDPLKDARLEALLLEGLASMRIPLDVDFRKRIEAKAEAILDKYKHRPML